MARLRRKNGVITGVMGVTHPLLREGEVSVECRYLKK